jgi:PAS domain S-box-containing protein
MSFTGRPSFPLLFAVSDSQETVLTVMMLGVGVGLGLLLLDYLLQKRRQPPTEPVTREVWLRYEYRKAVRTGLIVVVAYFEMICAYIFFTNAIIEPSRALRVGPTNVAWTLKLAGFLGVSASLLVWLLTWLFKHLHLVRSQATLFESEQRLRVALQATRQGLYDLDLRSWKSTTTPEYALMLGYDPATFRETHGGWIERLHPEDRDRLTQHFSDYVAGRIPEYRVESRQRTAGGEWKWILSIGKIVQRDPRTGQPLRMLGTYTDITEQKLAEQRIEEQAESLRKLSAHLVELQDAERRRVARELHDTTAQHLAALGMNLSVIEKLAGDSSPKVARLLVDSQTLVEQAMQEIRTTTYLLHPPLLDAAGLAGAVQDYADGFARRSGLAITVEVPPDFARLPRDVELALFRVVQEGLANVRRHSGSPSVTIRLAKSAAGVMLELRDAGRGIPPDKLARLRDRTGELGVGIAGMHERLHQLGGKLEIESHTNADVPGTAVRACWQPPPGAAPSSNA